ncbi:hypothetical protein QEN19_001770 [Hanseniaspora menglaensis]
MAINSAAATVCGLAGTICWCVQLVPQIRYIIKKKDSTGFNPIFMALWLLASPFLACYAFISNQNIAIRIQPNVFMMFCLVAYYLSCLYPPHKKSKKFIYGSIISFLCFSVALEVGFITWLKPIYEKGTHWPALIFGIISGVVLAAGILPLYYELAHRQGRVVGISFVFLSIDSLGAYLSILSVVLGTMDVMGIIMYSLIAVLEIGVFVSHFIWIIRFKWLGRKTIVDEENLVFEEFENETDQSIKSAESEKLSEVNKTSVQEM